MMDHTLTSTQKALYDAIKKNELENGEFSSSPRASHMGTSSIYGYNTGKQIHSGFQKRTFKQLVELGLLVQTMFMGYRLADGQGGYADLSLNKQSRIKQRINKHK